MKQSGENERTRKIRENIARLVQIDPKAQITKEELEEKKKRLWSMEKKTHAPFRSENHSGRNLPSQHREMPKQTNVIKKVLAFDSSYYKNLSHIYQRDSNSNSILKVQDPHSIQESKRELQEKQQERDQLPTIPAKVDSSEGFFRLHQVKNQEPIPQSHQQSPPEEKEDEKIHQIQEAEKPAQKQTEEITLKPLFSNQINSKPQQSTTRPQQSVNGAAPIVNPFSKIQVPTSFFGNTSSSPLFGSNTSTNQFSSESKNDQPNTQRPLGLFSLNQNIAKPSQQSAPTISQSIFGKPLIKNTPSQPKEETNKSETIQVKPLFDLPVKTQGIKVETQQNQSFQKPQQKKFFTQANKDDVEKKEVKIKSIFEASNEGALNLNPSKPAQASAGISLFQNKPKQEAENNIAKNVTTTWFFNPSQQKPLNESTIQKAPEKQENAKPTLPLSSIFSSPKNPESNSVPFFGQLGTPNLVKSNLFSTTTQQVQPKLNLFSTNTQPVNPIVKHEPQIIQPADPPNKEGLFSKKPVFFNAQATISKQAPSLFSGQKAEFTQAPQPIFPNKSSLPQVPEQKEDLSHKQSQKSEKREKSITTAIGPGGKKIEIQPIFQNESTKPNIVSPSVNDPSNLFKQPATTNLFQSAASSLFSTTAPTTGNLFLSSNTANLFKGLADTSPNASGNIFSQPSNSLFGNTGNSLFASQPRAQNDQEEGQDDGDDGPIEAQDDANPNLSTGKYDYIQTNVFFKENANKFREGNKETMENIVISIQKFEGAQDRFLYVRMLNKRIAFCGKIVQNITQTRILNNSAKNIEIKKILQTGENGNQPGLSVVRIQFKEEVAGERFIKEVNEAIRKSN